MRIRDIMSKPVVTLPPESTVGAARFELQLHGIEHVVVVAKHNIVGIVSDHDLVQHAEDTRLAEIMSREVVTISREATLRQAAGIMEGKNIGCLPVVGDRNVEGIVTGSDLLRAIAKGSAHAETRAERHSPQKRTSRKRHVRV